jgi:hypothetical protein
MGEIPVTRENPAVLLYFLAYGRNFTLQIIRKERVGGRTVK